MEACCWDLGCGLLERRLHKQQALMQLTCAGIVIVRGSPARQRGFSNLIWTNEFRTLREDADENVSPQM